MAKRSLTYAQSGVDIDAGDEVVDRIKGHLRRTYGPRVVGKYGGFAGCFRLDFNEKLFKRNYRDPVLVSCTDGVGSKVKIASTLKIYDTVGQDLVAMSVNDLIVQGAEPLIFLDYVAVNKVVPADLEQMVKGVADGCQIADCSLIGGETAEMPDVYAPGDFDMAGFAVGVCELNKIIEGDRAEVDDVIIGLASSGVHSNGYSLVRAVVREAGLDYEKVYPELDPQRPLGQVLLTPTRIYARPILSVLHHYRVKQPIVSMSHITGSGLPGNVSRTLGTHLDAKLDRKSWPMLPVFPFLQEHGGIADDEMYKVFNMGIGYVVVVRPWFAESVLEQLRKHGEQAQVIGKLVRGTGQVTIA
ncbi:MAG: phosphoribosylformylglycinamidine cyclo-ligase [Phycisphaeraceae bacterium]|nr:phosphoribosylformylglycinamidine cyclo-ligase [Phycisphaeraceae bacterium]